MSSTKIPTILTASLLGGAVLVTFLMPARLTIPSIHAAGPAVIHLPSLVRDFNRAHVDFDIVPADGYGHVAGTVAPQLASSTTPTFVSAGGGQSLASDVDLIAHWKLDDGAGSTAAEELGRNPGTLLSGPTWTTGQSGEALRFDGSDDYVNVPASPEMQINGDITLSGWFKLDEVFDHSSSTTMVIMEKFLDTEHDFHIALVGNDYNRPEVPKGTMVFKVESGPTGEYYRYKWTSRSTWAAGEWYHFAAVLTSSDTARSTLLIDGADGTALADAGGVGFVDTGYSAPLRIGGKTVDYNGVATDLYFKGAIDDVMIFSRALTEDDLDPTAGGYHVLAPWKDSDDRPIAPHWFDTIGGGGGVDACGTAPSDAAGVAGVPSSGGVTSAASFDQWFRDVLGTNLSANETITLTRDNAGVYSFLTDDFHPIDHRLYGNEGESHNGNLTVAIRSTFVYRGCGQQFIEFEGGDGCWVFVNGQLAIDLGGARSGTDQFMSLDRLGLTDGETYEIELFYAQRSPGSSTFRLRTNVELIPDPNRYTVTSMFD